jgi:hypothetical protein
MTKEQLKIEMKNWRAGFRDLPKEYIELHQFSARISLPKMAEAHGLRVLHTEMVSDGWFDGMKVLRAITEDRNGVLRDIRWSDANGGSWFEKSASGGQSLVNFIPDDRPGHL